MSRIISLIIFATMFAYTAFAQAGVSTSEIKGRITDPNGAVVAGATVTATDSEKGISRTATTDSDGEYRLLTLPPGTYQIRVQATGFSSQLVNAVQVTVGQTADQNFAMQIGDEIGRAHV